MSANSVFPVPYATDFPWVAKGDSSAALLSRSQFTKEVMHTKIIYHFNPKLMSTLIIVCSIAIHCLKDITFSKNSPIWDAPTIRGIPLGRGDGSPLFSRERDCSAKLIIRSVLACRSLNKGMPPPLVLSST